MYVMKKIFALTILILSMLTVSLFYGGNFAVNVHAETVTGAKLEYFELNKPLCVWRENNIVYIAEKELVVIYHNDTYKKVPFDGFNIQNIAKCGNHLLILSNSELRSLNLTTYESALLSLPNNPEIDFNNISSFAVSGNHFAINTNDRQIFLFEVTDTQNFVFNLVHSNTLTLDCSSQLALSPELQIYYHSPAQQNLHLLDTETSMQGPFQKVNAVNNVEHFAFDNNVFYYKANNVIYSLTNNLANASPQIILDLNSFGFEQSGDFFIQNDKLLICNTLGDAVVEYDLLTSALTGFEISFTKIDLPSDFAITYNPNPQFITAQQNVKLYDINLKDSFTKGYFVFNGYHEQAETRDYLVISEISNSYYLVAGDVVALVLKEDFSPVDIPKTNLNSVGFVTTNAKTYMQPRLSSEFASFTVAQFEQVNVICSFTLGDIDFSLISKNKQFGYIPSSFIVSSLKEAPSYNSFETATTVNKKINVYSDLSCQTMQDTLPNRTSVLIVEKSNDVYKIIYGDKVGYIKKENVEKRGKTTNKIVFVVFLLALGFLFTALHFEGKYLYTKKRGKISGK